MGVESRELRDRR